jgi:hypothetical protein
MSKFNIDVTVDDGKYRIIQHHSGELEILRYGEKWMGGPAGFAGSKMIIAMACELEELRARPVPDAAVQIGEEAFRAGFDAAAELLTKCGADEFADVREREWGKYEPSEAVKDLLR